MKTVTKTLEINKATRKVKVIEINPLANEPMSFLMKKVMDLSTPKVFVLAIWAEIHRRRDEKAITKQRA